MQLVEREREREREREMEQGLGETTLTLTLMEIDAGHGGQLLEGQVQVSGTDWKTGEKMCPN